MLLLIKFFGCLYLLGTVTALIYNRALKGYGLKGIGYKQCFNPLKQFSVILGFSLSLIPDHIIEQYVLRLYDTDCRAECYLGNGGKCVSCGCNTKAKMCSPFEMDSKDRWGRIEWSKEKYKKTRELYPVKITINYLKSESTV